MHSRLALWVMGGAAGNGGPRLLGGDVVVATWLEQGRGLGQRSVFVGVV